MNSDLSNVKAGDWVWTIKGGWEKVTEIDLEECSICTKSWYTSDGKEHPGDKYPSAFTSPPEGFNAEPKPCGFKKGDKVLVGDRPEYCNQRRYFSHMGPEGNYYCFLSGNTEWSQENGDTAAWSYCKKWEE